MSELIVNEAFLQQVETLQSVLKNNNAGMFGGNRKSKTYGSSCEFADYRDYMPGDDITKIDWNVYARFDKLYQKLYLDERQMHTRIYIDASRSMAYGNAEKGKQCLRLAATLAYLSLSEMEKVSIYVIRDKEVEVLINGIVGKNAYYEQIGKLNDIVFDGDSYIADAIVPSRVGQGDGMSILISDFLTDNNYETAIDRLADSKRDILCIQVLARDELNPSCAVRCTCSILRMWVSSTVRISIKKLFVPTRQRCSMYRTGSATTARPVARTICWSRRIRPWVRSSSTSW